jgi:uncharacterized protein YjiS (DUF1127 family)
MTANAAGSAWQWFAAAVVRPLRQQRLRREHERLDDAAFRDLGLSRSELGSFQAEAAGTSLLTRRRCAVLASAGPLKVDPMSRQNEGADSYLEGSQ